MPTPTVPAPVRVQCLDLTAEQLRDLNRARVKAGEPKWPSAASALAQLRRPYTKSLPEEALEVLWATHPDERVAVALAGRPNIWTLPGRYRAITAGSTRPPRVPIAGVDVLLYDRGMADAVREGVLWTPTLLALAKSGHWPSGDHGSAGSRIDLETYADRLRPWVESQTSPRAVDPLIETDDRVLYGVAIPALSCADMGTVRAARRGDGTRLEASALRLLAENETLRPAVRARVETTVLDLVARQKQQWVLQTPVITAIEARTATPGALHAGLRALAFGEKPNVTAARELVHLPETTGDDLLALAQRYNKRLLSPTEDGPSLVAHPNATPALWQYVAGCRHKAKSLLSMVAQCPRSFADPEMRRRFVDSGDTHVVTRYWPALTIEEFRHSFARVAYTLAYKGQGMIIPAMEKLPSAHLDALTKADWGYLLPGRGAPNLPDTAALALIPSARRDPLVRAHLLTDVMTWPLLHLLDDPEAGSATERDWMIEKLIKVSPTVLLQILEEGAQGKHGAVAALVTPEHFASLLRSPYAEIRQRAMLAAGGLSTWGAAKIGGQLTPSEPPPRRRS